MKEVTIDGATYTQQCTNKFCADVDMGVVEETFKLTNKPREATIETVECYTCKDCMFKEDYGCAIVQDMVSDDVLKKLNGLPDCCDDYVYKIKEK